MSFNLDYIWMIAYYLTKIIFFYELFIKVVLLINFWKLDSFLVINILEDLVCKFLWSIRMVGWSISIHLIRVSLYRLCFLIASYYFLSSCRNIIRMLIFTSFRDSYQFSFMCWITDHNFQGLQIMKYSWNHLCLCSVI